jgi:thioredoxin-like negative regulator of GroEL
MALGTAAVLDVLLLATFGWSELIGEGLRTTLWVAFGVFWATAVVWSVRQCRRRAAAENPNPKEDAFREALDHYLGGDYYQAEHLLEGLLQRNPRDLDARLMLATLLRHTGRLDEALWQLDTLARSEGAGKWEWEIQHERDLLAEARTEKIAAA